MVTVDAKLKLILRSIPDAEMGGDWMLLPPTLSRSKWGAGSCSAAAEVAGALARVWRLGTLMGLIPPTSSSSEHAAVDPARTPDVNVTS